MTMQMIPPGLRKYPRHDEPYYVARGAPTQVDVTDEEHPLHAVGVGDGVSFEERDGLRQFQPVQPGDVIDPVLPDAWVAFVGPLFRADGTPDTSRKVVHLLDEGQLWMVLPGRGGYHREGTEPPEWTVVYWSPVDGRFTTCESSDQRNALDAGHVVAYDPDYPISKGYLFPTRTDTPELDEILIVPMQEEPTHLYYTLPKVPRADTWRVMLINPVGSKATVTVSQDPAENVPTPFNWTIQPNDTWDSSLILKPTGNTWEETVDTALVLSLVQVSAEQVRNSYAEAVEVEGIEATEVLSVRPLHPYPYMRLDAALSMQIDKLPASGVGGAKRVTLAKFRCLYNEVFYGLCDAWQETSTLGVDDPVECWVKSKALFMHTRTATWMDEYNGVLAAVQEAAPFDGWPEEFTAVFTAVPIVAEERTADDDGGYAKSFVELFADNLLE